MAHFIHLSLGAFMSSLGVKGCTKSWEAHERDHISKKHFPPGGMAPSEWTRSVRTVRDTPVEDYSAPGANMTRRVAYHPLIAISPFLLALSESYCK